MKILNILILLGVFLLNSCNSDKNSTANNNVESNTSSFTTDHYNITISSDLSNRLRSSLYPKAVSDVEIVSIVADNIYPRILMHKRSMNQLDHFRIDFINKKQISAYSVDTKIIDIDFSQFKLQANRIDYLRHSFQTDKNKFSLEFNRIHQKAIATSFGSDIWTYLQQGIDNSIVDTTTSEGKIGSTNFKNQFKNVLILLTDGYIEAGIYGKGFDISGRRIAEFRKKFLQSGGTNINTYFKKDTAFRVNALSNPLLKNLEVLVLELYDRSETNSGASVHPTDLEIMKLLWEDWLKRSQVKRYELHPKFSNKAEAEKVIFKFLGV
ncbi:hypothetical protein ACVWYN_001699 [Pedobacter sp. UYP24]